MCGNLELYLFSLDHIAWYVCVILESHPLAVLHTGGDGIYQAVTHPARHPGLPIYTYLDIYIYMFYPQFSFSMVTLLVWTHAHNYTTILTGFSRKICPVIWSRKKIGLFFYFFFLVEFILYTQNQNTHWWFWRNKKSLLLISFSIILNIIMKYFNRTVWNIPLEKLGILLNNI